ncbi:hypothetical protein [Hymenobacter cheonanensis]|uniref:hypothetical protein n=1 Tax=Hymenobacter sp. CA2-7 TaxID=3063993 RepID=UPI0027128DF8|nr:hypothetical protein [Hymenobacter sp. CA2-7]MDO7887949.1 hypothetical protein [Hymenobacter sp. CA2-7]
MKSFLFESIYLLSNKEKKARTIKFHPEKNLLRGRNHTGKSSLIKNLFIALGARPKGKLDKWDEDAISVVIFSVDGEQYKVVHQIGNRALFNQDNELIVASGNFREWSDAFAKVVGFNLVLNNKNSGSALADPKCFFLPFYINQDGSWQASWDTFSGLQQYKSPSAAIIDYFTGIKPPKYYEINSSKSLLQKTLDDLHQEQKLLKRTRMRFDEKMTLSGPKVQSGNFETEIAMLTSEVNAINKKQELLRESAVREQEILHNISVQINLANDTLAVYEKDVNYLKKSESHTQLECPTCGVIHEKSFLEVLTYADDARSLRKLVIELNEDAEKVNSSYTRTQQELLELEKDYSKVAAILDRRKGDLKFSDVVASLGAENAFKVFEEEGLSLNQAIDAQAGEIQRLNEELKALTDISRSKSILSSFRNAYRSALTDLNLPIIDTSKLKLTSRPDISGSGGPRSILAYYAALWSVCGGTYANFSVPLVIDSPNQQGQDDVNMPVILKFISQNLPKNSQVILGSEVDTEQEFDKKMVFENKYSMLLTEEYDKVKSVVTPLVDRMFVQLQTNKYAVDEN